MRPRVQPERDSSGWASRNRRRPRVEALESRCLLAAPITEFLADASGGGVTVGRDNAIWFTGTGISRIDVKTHAISEFAIPTDDSSISVTAQGITLGPGGNVWFTERLHYTDEAHIGLPPWGEIGELNVATGAITQIPLPGDPNDIPRAIAAGPDGNIWFSQSGVLAQLNPATHDITKFSVSSIDSQALAPGSDGNFWFSELTGGLGSFNLNTHEVNDFPLPGNNKVEGITNGPDGNIWFTEANPGRIGRINPLTHAIDEFPVPNQSLPNAGRTSHPTGITTGPDGNVWFTEQFSNRVGKINPTASVVTEYALQHESTNPMDIVAGPDGNLWFAETGFSTIGRNLELHSAIAVFQLAPGPVQPAQSPRVVSLQRTGYHAQQSALVVTFNAPLDASRAGNLANYRLVSAGRDHRFGTHDDRVIRLRSASYDPASQTVKLFSAQPLPLRQTYQLTVNGHPPTGLTDPFNQPIDGAGDGTVGSDFVGLVNRQSLINSVPAKAGRHHASPARTFPRTVPGG